MERRLNEKRWSGYLTNPECLLLLAIFLLGILVRVVGISGAPRGFNQDEASAGYDAFAILKTGMDRNGIRNPIHLIAWGSGQNAAYSWLCMPFIALFGLSVWSVRIPMALVGSASLVVFYFLLKNIHRENKAFVLMGTFLFAIFPWHIMKSRWALESNLFPDLVLWGTFCLSQFLKNGKPGWFYGALALFAFSAYAYGTAYCFLPFFVLPVLLWMLVKKKLSWKRLISGGCLMGLLMVPILLFVFINTFRYPEIDLGVFTIPRLYTARHTSVASVFSKDFFRSSWENLLASLKILVVQYDDAPWNAIRRYGMTYPFTLPLALWGLVRCFQSFFRGKASDCESLMDFWFLSCVVLMFISAPNINRMNIVAIPWMYFTIAGTVDIAQRLWHGKILAMTAYALCFLLFCRSYFTSYQERIGREFFAGLGPAIEAASQMEEKIVYVTDTVNMPYIYTLFFTQTDVRDFRATAQYETSHVSFEEVGSFGKYVFHIPETIDEEEDAAYVVSQEELERFDLEAFQVTRYDNYYLCERTNP